MSYTIPSASYATVDENCKVSASYLFDVDVRDVVMVGLPFYENYVAVYDYDVKKIRLGLNVNAVEGASINADAHWDPVIKKLKEFSGWALAAIIAGIVITVVLLIVCIGYFCRMFINKRQVDKEAKYALYSNMRG